jgi:hypothetical protein
MFTSIKQNLIYIVMFGAIILAIFYSSDFNKSEVKLDGQENDDNIDVGLVKKSKFPLQVIIVVSFVLVGFIFLMVSGSKQYVQEAKKETPKKSFVGRMTKEEFETAKKENTRRELEKLMQTPQFKQMVEQKGDDPKNWIWQIREKEKKTVYRDRESSDDENLSQITVSDD